MAAREGVGVAIGLVGVVLLTRLMGPVAYGVYAAAVALMGYLAALGQWGLRVQLVSHPVEPEPDEYKQAFTLLVLFGVLGLAVGFAVAPVFESWSGIQGLALPVRVLVATLPGVLAVQVPRSQLERRLAYRQIATVELIGQLTFYAVALPAAFLDMGVWAPVAGLWGQQLVTWLLVSLAARFRPGLHWERGRVARMMREGFEYTVASWLWQARSLVNPLIVGHFLGATGVAFVDLTVRFADNLSFIRSTASRISLPILSQLQLEAARLVRTIEEGTRWQMLPLGVGFVGFVWLAPFVVPLVFGSDWSPVLILLPFVAFGYLTNTLFTLQISGLFVLRRNLAVAAVHLVHVVLFALTAAVLVPRIGLVGYGYGEIAGTAAYILLHLFFSRAVQRPDYRVAGMWWIAFGAACFAQPIGWWMAVPLLILLVSPGFWRQVRALLRQWSVAWARPAPGKTDSGS